MNTIGRNIAHHQLYPNSSYVPRRAGVGQVFREIGSDLWAFLGSKMWFWGVAIAAFTWLAYHFVRWAMAVPGTMRIN
jgi:hypothetical protein